MQLNFTVTGENYDRILKQAVFQAEKFFEKCSQQWKIEVGEIVVTKETWAHGIITFREYQAEITVTPYAAEPVPYSPYPYGRDVEFVAGIGRVKE